MKFRALMQNQQNMAEFLNVVLTLSKLAKNCVMNISSQKINFIVNEDPGNGTPLAWAEIITEINFDEYIMEGVKENYQYIILSFNPSKLARAISALRYGPKYFKLKLTNIQYPCLTIEIEVVSNLLERYRQIIHDVPVDIIPRVNWSSFAMPQVPSPNIFLTLSSSGTIRNQIDKLRNISSSITFYATSYGEMNIAAETESSIVTTKYKNLKVQEIDTVEGGCGTRHIKAACRVDCKRIADFFSSLQVSTLEWSYGISNNALIHLEIKVKEGVTVHSIIPAVSV